jgi:hypothetical protein
MGNKHMQLSVMDIGFLKPEPRFNINYNLDASPDLKQVEKEGLLYPIIISPSGLIVDGYKRYRLIKKLHRRQVETIIPDHLDNALACARYRKMTLSKSRDPDILQKVSLYNYIVLQSIPGSECDQFRRELNLPLSEDIQTKLNKILDWPELVKTYIHQFHLSHNQIKTYLDMPTEDLVLLFDLGSKLSMRPVELQKIATLMTDISLNRGCPLQNLFEDTSVSLVLNDSGLNRNQKIVHLKNVLTELRTPVITSYQKSIEDELKQLSLGENIRIRFDKTFESGSLHMDIKLSYAEELKQLAEDLGSENTLSIMKRIFEKI